MGGAIAVLLADRRPDLVRGLISVEGNFTGKDTFWSAKIVRKSLQDWTNEYQKMRRDVRAWTERVGVEPTERAVAWMTTILDHQPASTVYAMSHAILDETLSADYLASVQRVIDRDVPIHLIAGERSAGSWGVPEFARAAARTDTVIPHTGHLMMLEDPDAFCRTVDKILAPDTTST
jgi:pimeloyl-ACP methyl ester carboxylesterase